MQVGVQCHELPILPARCWIDPENLCQPAIVVFGQRTVGKLVEQPFQAIVLFRDHVIAS
jgi:hypothetical protein